MRYGECYVALRSQRTNHVLHCEDVYKRQDLNTVGQQTGVIFVRQPDQVVQLLRGIEVPLVLPEPVLGDILQHRPFTTTSFKLFEFSSKKICKGLLATTFTDLFL